MKHLSTYVIFESNGLLKNKIEEVLTIYEDNAIIKNVDIGTNSIRGENEYIIKFNFNIENSDYINNYDDINIKNEYYFEKDNSRKTSFDEYANKGKLYEYLNGIKTDIEKRLEKFGFYKNEIMIFSDKRLISWFTYKK